MPDYLLHGLWFTQSGLNLWIEQVKGHRVVTLEQVPEGTFPPIVHSLLSGTHFHHRESVKLQTPRGKSVRLNAPTVALAPSQAVSFLASIEQLDSPSPAATSAQREAVAPDLYWLIRMYKGLSRFVAAGRVSIHVPNRDGQWYANWQLGTGVEERGWLAEMMAAAPGVLVANNPALSEDMAKTLVHWITAAKLESAGAAESIRPHAQHDFIQSLLTSAPLRRGSAALSKRVGDWNGSITAVNLQLVFIASDPVEPPEAAGTLGGAEGGLEVEAEAAWPVRVQVRSGTDAPRPVRQLDYDGQTAEKLRAELQRAIAATELVDPVRHPRPGYVPAPADEGDWDAYLTTDEIVRFVTTDAARLRLAGFAVMLPKAWATAETRSALKVTQQDNPYDSSTVTHLGFDTLMTYDWRISVGGVELTDAEMEQLVRSKSGLVKLRDEWVLADTAELARTQKYMRKLHEKEDASGAVSASDLRELALESSAEANAQAPLEFTGSTWFTSLVGGTDRPAPERVEVPATVDAELREYQRRGVDWLYFMSRNNLGAVLADDMGLGKTLQLLTLLAVEKDNGLQTGPSLVIAPTSVVGNWAREAARFTPGMKVLVHHGAQRAKGEEFAQVAAAADLVVTSYGVVSRDHQDLGRVRWDHVVLDEAQAIKNAGTMASKSVRSIPARHRIALTGTPIENKLSELRSILDFVNPGMLGSQSFFRNHFAKAIERGQDDAQAREMGERLQRLTAPFILRRLKTDPAIVDDLPDKAEHVIGVDMTAEQAALYKALVDETQRELERRQGMARKGLVLATITRIKQICNHPAHFLGDGSPVTDHGRQRSGKVGKLVEILDQAAETGQRVLIFTQYKAFGDILQPYLAAHLGQPVPFLHGGVGKSARDAMVEDFQRPDGPPAMLLSLKAGGTGLNLTAASIVVHMDRWWNPAVENQATDRAFRIGQARDVTVYKMITRGTMEERIQEVLDGKMHLAGAVVGEGEGWITELDAEDLAKLISFRGQDE